MAVYMGQQVYPSGDKTAEDIYDGPNSGLYG